MEIQTDNTNNNTDKPNLNNQTHYFSFDFKPNDIKSEGLASFLFYELGLDRSSERKLQQRYLHTRIDTFERVLGTLIIKTNLAPSSAVYHSLMTSSFNNEPVSYRLFNTTVTRLIDQGYLTHEKGNQYTRLNQEGELISLPKASHFYPTEKLVSLCNDYGVYKENLRSLFEHIRPNHFVQVRSPTIKNGRSTTKGNKVSISKYEESLDYIDQQTKMKLLNDYLWDQTISGTSYNGLWRGFNNYTDENYKYDQGGRLYCFGTGYQSIPKERRSNIKINGENTVEIDIKSSHLTILHGLKGIPIPDGDPYDLPGIPRPIVKQWMTISLATTKPLQRWPNETRQELVSLFYDLSEFTAPKVSTAVLERYPFLNDMNSNDHGWAKFQYIESEIIINTMLELIIEHDVPALPVHDSLIVPESASELTQQLLKKHSNKILGIEVQLEVSSPQEDEFNEADWVHHCPSNLMDTTNYTQQI